MPGLSPEVLLGAIPEAGLSGNQIAVPRSVPGGVLDHFLGKVVELEYTKVVGAGREVVAIIDNATPGEAGPTPSCVADAALENLVRESGAVVGTITYTTAYVQTASATDVPRVQTELANQGFAVSSVATQLRSLGGLFQVLGRASWIFGALLVLVCFVMGRFRSRVCCCSR